MELKPSHLSWGILYQTFVAGEIFFFYCIALFFSAFVCVCVLVMMVPTNKVGFE